MTRVKYRHCFAMLLGLLILSGCLQAQESGVVNAMIEEAGGDLEHLQQIINEHEQLIQKYPDGAFVPTVMYQLAELYSERSRLLYEQEMELYESQLKQYDRGERSVEPPMPTRQIEKTVYYCQTILDSFPQIHFADRVLYTLGITYLQGNRTQKAQETFSRLVHKFEHSALAMEAQFRIGEYYFNNRNFKQAIIHYRNLLQHWDNPYFDMALYKLGWAYYNLEQYSDAISSFLSLIKDLEMLERVESQELMVPKTDLRTEAIHYIASAFTEYAEPSIAGRFLESFKKEPFTQKILLNMAQLYEQRTFYLRAIKTYEIISVFFPFDPNLPQIYDSIIHNYEQAGDTKLANATRRSAIDVFGPEGEWSEYHASDSLYNTGMQVARSHLIYLGTYYQSLASRSGEKEHYHTAIDLYDEFIHHFPEQSNADTLHYYLAECYYQLNNYEKAAEMYQTVVDHYPNSEYCQDAAFNRILCWVDALHMDEKQPPFITQIVNFIGTSDTLSVSVVYESDAQLLQACNDFILRYPSSEWVDQVYMKFGETLASLDYYLKAVQVYDKVIKDKESPYLVTAYMNAGHAYFKSEAYNKAEQMFEKVSESDTTERSRQATQMAASAKFKKADNLSRNGHYVQAGELLLSIAETSKDTVFQERALFNAAVQFQTANRKSMAARLYERLEREHSSSDMADEALYKAGTLHQELENWILAASDFIRLADRYTRSPFYADALKKAGLYYEQSENWAAAQMVYQRYAETFPDRIEALEYLYKSGQMAYKCFKYTQSRQLFEKIVSLYNNGQDADIYYVAAAQFMIGEISFEDFKKLNIEPPLKKNLERKTKSFQHVIEAYTATVQYQVAEWTTASLHRVGMAFEELVRAFEESPPPMHLDEEQKELYRAKLSQSAFPYKQKALEAFKKNVSQAESNQIDNIWVKRSRLKIKELTSELDSNVISSNES